jgi:phosphate transport system protein
VSHRHFQDDLDKLNGSLIRMAGLAETAVKTAVEALTTRSRDIAYEVIDQDGGIDAAEMEIDDLAVNLLALQQPMARDLRLITIAMKIANDLERVGDHAVNIAETVIYMVQGAHFPVLPEIEEMARISTDMLSVALDSFIRGDAVMARTVIKRDDRVDELHANNFRILLTHMMEDPRRIGAGMDLLLVSGNLERIADLATNISEDVVYLVEGRSIKHRSADRRDRENGAAFDAAESAPADLPADLAD